MINVLSQIIKRLKKRFIFNYIIKLTKWCRYGKNFGYYSSL